MGTKKASEKMTALDLFSGAGGLTLGLKMAGFKVLAGIEIDDVAAETYRMNHPDVLCVEKDIKKIDAVALMKQLGLKTGELSLLAGCPPCQGFSTLRTNNKSVSVSDHRNNLLFEYLRFVEAFRPKALMMENVPSLASDARMTKLLKGLSDLGYKIGENSVRIEDAANYGVPQRRKRMILQVLRKGVLAEADQSEAISVREHLNAAKLKPVGKSGDKLHDHITLHSDKVMQIIKSVPKDGGSRADLPPHLVLPCHQRRPSGFRDVYGRMKWDDVAPTITGGCGNPSKGRYLHPSENRAISLREAALLQTFPVDYQFSLRKGRGKVALMIGNALPPEFIKRHATALADALTQ